MGETGASARPICFMIMPFGVKATQAAPGISAPDKVDFDRLWDAALRPAIEAVGYEPIRANEDIGPLIITEMIERLAISDLVLADVSIPNGNVYYEVGIRHAARKEGCIMTAANWSKQLFDIEQMRQVRYPLAQEKISDQEVEKLREDLQKAIKKETASPFYQVFPDYPKYDSGKSLSFRKSWEELAQFQAGVMAARAAKGDERRTRALELRSKYGGSGPVQKAIALELMFALRDCVDWKTAEDFIQSLPNDLRTSPLVKEQHALAIAKLGNNNEAIGALQALIAGSGDTSERRGLLGGRYKKMWMASGDSSDLHNAITEYERGMKLDLNDYYPSSNLPRLYRRRKRKGDEERARTAAAVVMTACERARTRNASDKWLNATLLGAAFDSGDVEKVEELTDLVAAEGAAKWEIRSTLDDCRVAVSLHNEEKQRELQPFIERLAALVE